MSGACGKDRDIAGGKIERLAPVGEKAAQAIGVVIVGTGLLLIARAGGVG